MSVELAENALATDAEGPLVDPLDWNEEVASELARRENIAMTPDHWLVMAFMREYYDEHQVAADARFTIKFIAGEMGYGAMAKNRLFEMSPLAASNMPAISPA